MTTTPEERAGGALSLVLATLMEAEMTDHLDVGQAVDALIPVAATLAEFTGYPLREGLTYGAPLCVNGEERAALAKVRSAIILYAEGEPIPPQGEP